jgi:hypothetical protein
LCRDKKKTIVEYALANSTHPIGVASYVVSKVLPKNLKGKLPTEEQIARLLEAVSDYESASLDVHISNAAPKREMAKREIVPSLVAQTKTRKTKSNTVRVKAPKKLASARKSKK